MVSRSVRNWDRVPAPDALRSAASDLARLSWHGRCCATRHGVALARYPVRAPHDGKAPGLTAVLVVTLALGIGATHDDLQRRQLGRAAPAALRAAGPAGAGVHRVHRQAWALPRLGLAARATTISSAAVDSCDGDRRVDVVVRLRSPAATARCASRRRTRPDRCCRSSAYGRCSDAGSTRVRISPAIRRSSCSATTCGSACSAAIRQSSASKIHLDALPVTVVGVMPQGFDFLDREDAWVPAAARLREGGRRQLQPPRRSSGSRPAHRSPRSTPSWRCWPRTGRVWRSNSCAAKHGLPPMALSPMIARRRSRPIWSARCRPRCGCCRARCCSCS